MSYVYSVPERETEPFTLPNVEVFYVSQLEVNYNMENMDHVDEYTITEPGWYWWTCFPGCLPDSEAIGPFETEQDATRDAQEYD